MDYVNLFLNILQNHHNGNLTFSNSQDLRKIAKKKWQWIFDLHKVFSALRFLLPNQRESPLRIRFLRINSIYLRVTGIISSFRFK